MPLLGDRYAVAQVALSFAGSMKINRLLILRAVPFIVACAAISCKTNVPPLTVPPAPKEMQGARFSPVGTDALPNAHRITDKVFCGGLPDGERGFQALAALGVKTVISVDGITPQVDLAHAHGMRYVHLPFGYDGVPESQGEAIAKAIEDFPGPVYVHCHHGQHRGPAAAVVGCVMNGTLPHDQVEAVLTVFGTGVEYKGLWESVRAARPVDPSTLRHLKVDFLEKAPIPRLADSMVRIDDAFDTLKTMQKSKWRSKAAPADAALQLEELLKEVGRSDAASAKPEDFHQLLDVGVRNAEGLRALLATSAIDPPAAGTALATMGTACANCHKLYRNKKAPT